MSREIEFRAWDGSEMIFMDMKKHGIYICGSHKALMQYTNLKDKNGKKIFEGDILEHKDYVRDGSGNFKTVREEIKYSDEKAGYCLNGCGAIPFEFAEKNIEVVGNIYENEGLLK